MNNIYTPKKIEKYVQNFWKKNKSFKIYEKSKKQKFYCLSMIPYPSGKLHMGHIRNYTIGDIISRYQRMLGKNVFYPIGWDSFGLPAENAAIENNIEPKIWTNKNILYMKKQLQSLGFSYDWEKEINTCDPNYYKWEQLFFIKLYKKKLIYRKKEFVNWCKKDQTVLANEQVIKKRCWRCQSRIKKKKIYQWFIKITKYANQLLYDLKKLKDWPKKVKNMQKNWIGKSTKLKIKCKIYKKNKKISVYTSKPILLMSSTYIKISINNKLAIQKAKKHKKIYNFIKKYSKKNLYNKKKYHKIYGINTNLYIIHPINKKKIPIWITNFYTNYDKIKSKLGNPAHNKNDWKFAKKYKIPIIHIFQKKKKTFKKYQKINKKDKLYNSKQFNGLNYKNGNKIIKKILIKLNIGKYITLYKLKDWCISRQRYWGTPIPILYLKNKKIITTPIKKIPIKLPKYIKKKNYLYFYKKWKKTNFLNQKAIKETDTFDTFIESSWYYIYFFSLKNKKKIIHKNHAKYWLPIDLYIGGIEHAVLHLLYLRFYHKLLRDENLLYSDEPIKKLLCQGMILNKTFYYFNKKKEKIWISPNKVKTQKNNQGKINYTTNIKNQKIFFDGMKKMSKSKNNGINPSKIIKKYGADALRLFIIFSGPTNIDINWKEQGIKGTYRFLKKIWKIIYLYKNNQKNINLKKNNITKKIKKKIQYKLEKTIKKVTKEINKINKLNIAISSIMKFIKELNNLIKKIYIKKKNIFFKKILNKILLILNPFAPHICFILWKKLGNKKNIEHYKWPIFNINLIQKNTKNILIQINGKFKHIINIPNNYKKNKILQIILKKPNIKKLLYKKNIKKTLYIKNKILNFII